MVVIGGGAVSYERGTRVLRQGPSGPLGCSSFHHRRALELALQGGPDLRLIDSCITQLKAQGPSRTYTESKDEEEEGVALRCLKHRASKFLPGQSRLDI